MKLAIGILLVLIGLYFIGVTIRMVQRRLHWVSIGLGVVAVLVPCGVGIALALGASWWSLLIGAVIYFGALFVLSRAYPIPSVEEGKE